MIIATTKMLHSTLSSQKKARTDYLRYYITEIQFSDIWRYRYTAPPQFEKMLPHFMKFYNNSFTDAWSMTQEQVQQMVKAIQDDAAAGDKIAGPAFTLAVAQFYGTQDTPQDMYNLAESWFQEAGIRDWLLTQGHVSLYAELTHEYLSMK